MKPRKLMLKAEVDALKRKCSEWCDAAGAANARADALQAKLDEAVCHIRSCACPALGGYVRAEAWLAAYDAKKGE